VTKEIWVLIRTYLRRKQAEQFLAYRCARSKWLQLYHQEVGVCDPDLVSRAVTDFRAFMGKDKQ